MIPEIQTDIERLRALRGDMLKTLDGASRAALNWKPTPRGTNSLFVLATHLRGSEQHWIHRVIGGQTIARDRDAEFRARGADAEKFRAEFAANTRASEAVLGALSEADLNATRAAPNYGDVSVRWVIVHVIEHYAEHAGQMSLTRQVWENQVKSKKRKVKSRKSLVKRSARKKIKRNA